MSFYAYLRAGEARYQERFGLDFEEFEDLVHSIAQTADHWDDRLAKELASPGGSLA